MRLKNLMASTEAIDYQYGSQLRAGLVAIFERLQEKSRVTARDVEISRIPELVERQTGIKIGLTLLTHIQHYAAVQPPRLDINNPLFNKMNRTGQGNTDLYKLIKDSDKIVQGGVNLKNGKITGDFTKLESMVYLGVGLFNKRLYTPEESTAILLHEIGHVFTYFEYLGETVRTNTVLHAVGEFYRKETGTEKRITLLHEVDKAAGIEIPEKDTMAKSKDGKLVQAIIVRESMKMNRSELGTPFYDERTYEFLSDQFATRHGAGVELATGLAKIHRYTNSKDGMSTPAFLLWEILNLITIVIGWGLPLVIALMGMAFGENTYDGTRDRMHRMRDQLVNETKNPQLDRVRRADLLESIDKINKTIEETNQRNTLVEFVWNVMTPWGRQRASMQQVQQELEELANNNLFVQSARFRNL